MTRPAPEPRLEAWLGVMAEPPDAQPTRLRQAVALVEANHPGAGLERALAVARMVHDLGLDGDAVVATVLHAGTGAAGWPDDELLRERFGDGVVRLLTGLGRMDVLPEQPVADDAGHRDGLQAEGLRKMLLAMVEDVRVVVIKLADRVHSLRTLRERPPAEQVAFARQTMDLFAPLANRLGIWQLKWELEDLSLRVLEPEAYRDIAARLKERRVDREGYLADFTATLEVALARDGIAAEVSGRPKHIFSIWKKMRDKDVDFERILDVRAARILVDDIADCYRALGVVHGLWPHIPGEFDDYVATPKKNGYRSIHTAVIGPAGKVVEVQIRTREMHRHNEFGVAAHWRYKEGVRADLGMEARILWLRQLLEWKDEAADATDLLDRFHDEVFEDRVYVFTPAGRVVDLPRGATPVDFAYAVHSEVGHHCRGAKVDGRMVPLTRPLESGQQVEILTARHGGPSRDWLSPHLGYVHTRRARGHIQRWFKQQDFDKNLAAGRSILERELQRLGQTRMAYDALARLCGYAQVDDFLAALGAGDLKATQLAGRLQPAEPPTTAPRRREVPEPRGRGLRIQGVGNLLTRLASCCMPLPGDAIAGYITRGQGVTIHRRDCPNLRRFAASRFERVVEVEWGPEEAETHPVDVELVALDRRELLHDVTRVLADARVNVLGVNSRSDREAHRAYIGLTLEIGGVKDLERVLGRLARVSNVLDVRRVAR
ncbi:MAG: bifunctional (p)ppGpp synthetase/guanosine-3',5'-bis(diphosphate) 3'-pyrophosphohydrolase [Gammaproteobacteria bacterium]|nr:bifunctional (p)ppGpp synthetase/guanosine-3',5'-bis(diphosphate) 3'-pyrophosphohydrolase [Gammaproteobacteria bacterium]